jgi:dihydrofolate synthase/folylpolyglutamate synthase
MHSLYQQAQDYIYNFIDYETMRQPRAADYFDLRRVEELLQRLGNPHLKAKTVHIAGTKGKGSVAAMIASVLTAAGYKTGLYTSPHLIDLRERIRIDGQYIPQEKLIELTDMLKPRITAVNRKANYGRLTTFEVLTVLGFSYFAAEKADFQVVEVGLGGRLDATNVVQPEVCVITTVGLDHMDTLGGSLAQITAEKTGIIKAGTAIISSPQVEEVLEVIAETCRRTEVELVLVGRDVHYKRLGLKADRQLIEIKGRLGSYSVASPLLGGYQLENTATAVAALEGLAERGYSIIHESVIKGLEEVSWPGRFQVLAKKPLVIADGAHNPAAIRQLKRSLADYISREDREAFTKSVLVFGTSEDKDIGAIIAELAGDFNIAIVTHSSHPRAMDTTLLAAEFEKYRIETFIKETVVEAVEKAFSIAGKDGFICITGSLFVVGDAIQYMKAINS